MNRSRGAGQWVAHGSAGRRLRLSTYQSGEHVNLNQPTRPGETRVAFFVLRESSRMEQEMEQKQRLGSVFIGEPLIAKPRKTLHSDTATIPPRHL